MSKNGPIIIVEDDIDDQEMIAEALSAIGVSNEVKIFNGGMEVLEYLLQTQDTPFIIFSDINMPFLRPS